MSDNINNNSEEVDLGTLFKLIGDGFRNMFRAIGRLFSRLFHYIITSIIFIKTHFIKIAIASILGGVLGYVLEMNNEPVYQSDTILETNFGSGQELYNKTNYLNSLIKQGKHTKLASIFDIPEKDSKALLNFNIEPYEKKKSTVEEFNYYIQHTDTSFTKDLTLDIYANRLKDEDFRLQKITAYAKNQSIFEKLNNGVRNLAKNDYYNNLLSIKREELTIKKERFKRDLSDIDSIRKTYRKATILSANHPNSKGTNISFSENRSKEKIINKNNPDIDLFEQSDIILDNLKEVNDEIMRSGFITNTITEFSLGNSNNGILNSKWFNFSVWGGLLMILLLLIIQFNKYLENYNKKS